MSLDAGGGQEGEVIVAPKHEGLNVYVTKDGKPSTRSYTDFTSPGGMWKKSCLYRWETSEETEGEGDEPFGPVAAPKTHIPAYLELSGAQVGLPGIGKGETGARSRPIGMQEP